MRFNIPDQSTNFLFCFVGDRFDDVYWTAFVICLVNKKTHHNIELSCSVVKDDLVSRARSLVLVTDRPIEITSPTIVSKLFRFLWFTFTFVDEFCCCCCCCMIILFLFLCTFCILFCLVWCVCVFVCNFLPIKKPKNASQNHKYIPTE